eukprot:5865514-Pyramimonas_sp.AAC.1
MSRINIELTHSVFASVPEPERVISTTRLQLDRHVDSCRGRVVPLHLHDCRIDHDKLWSIDWHIR